MGLVGWLKEARELLLGGSVSMASDKQAELLLPPGNYLRLNSERGTQVDFDDYERCRGQSSPGKWCRSSGSCSSVVRVAGQAARSSASFSSLMGGFSSGLRSKRVLIEFWET
jgi:hypothetical protein